MCSFFKELTEESRRTIKLGDDWRAKTVDEALATVVNSETVRALFAGTRSPRPKFASGLRPRPFRVNAAPVFGLPPDLLAPPPTKQILTMRFMAGDDDVTIRYDPYGARRHLERALELRRAHLGRHHPQTLETMDGLGVILLSLKEYAEAEPLLLAFYEGMTQREAMIPKEGEIRLTDAVERLVQLYDAWDKKDKADEWRKELATRKTQSPAK